jgi:mono/diheme cytochrome c family protein
MAPPSNRAIRPASSSRRRRGRLAVWPRSVYLARMARRVDFSISVTTLAAALLLPGAGAASAASSGEVLYLRYCASCHGLDGRGGGPVAPALQPPPPDLTRLTSGEAELMKQIDGRRTIRAHGTSAMPVWGAVFEQSLIDAPHQRRMTLNRVMALTDYVLRLRHRATEPSPTPE